MPYIKQDDRKHYAGSLDDLTDDIEEMGPVSGHVTYILFMIVARWFKQEPSYNTICKIRGCLIGTLAEFDRRIAAPYEDTKIRENGDVDVSARAQCIHLAYSCEVCEPIVSVDEPEPERMAGECDCGRELLGVHSRIVHDADNEDEFGRFVVTTPEEVDWCYCGDKLLGRHTKPVHNTELDTRGGA